MRLSPQVKDRLLSYSTALLCLLVLTYPILVNGWAFVINYCAHQSPTLFFRIGGVIVIVTIIAVAVEIRVPEISLGPVDQKRAEKGDLLGVGEQIDFVKKGVRLKRGIYAFWGVTGTFLSTFGDLAFSFCPAASP